MDMAYLKRIKKLPACEADYYIRCCLLRKINRATTVTALLRDPARTTRTVDVRIKDVDKFTVQTNGVPVVRFLFTVSTKNGLLLRAQPYVEKNGVEAFKVFSTDVHSDGSEDTRPFLFQSGFTDMTNVRLLTTSLEAKLRELQALEEKMNAEEEAAIEAKYATTIRLPLKLEPKDG